jgi:hypothetical protein
MPFEIATGTYTSADSLLPLQTEGSGISPLAEITPVASAPDPQQAQSGVMPTTAMLSEQMAAGEADVRAAQASAMSAEDRRRGHYQAQAMPVGGHVGDVLTLPDVPANAVPPAMSDDYPYAGLEPTPAGAGLATSDTLPGP